MELLGGAKSLATFGSVLDIQVSLLVMGPMLLRGGGKKIKQEFWEYNTGSQ
jgi:hypothetical protein